MGRKTRIDGITITGTFRPPIERLVITGDVTLDFERVPGKSAWRFRATGGPGSSCHVRRKLMACAGSTGDNPA